MLQEMSFGQRLRRERQKRRWTQEELAKQIGVAKLTIIRWENDQAQPHPAMERKLYELFGKTAESFGMTRSPFWNVPFERNPYFRGRDEVLTSLRKSLTDRGQVALTQHALSGLGGIGKTQTAVEYAYRYAHEYEAVLWVRADSRELLASEFASLADVLGLRKRAEEDQQRAINAVRYWLQTYTGWLVIFDNVEDIEMISDFLPKLREGAVLMTTRVQVRGKYIKKIDIDKLSHEESIRFLLLRARLAGSEDRLRELAEEEQQAAEQLCRLLDGLPLALEQAAAYIEENQRSIDDYLHLYMQHRSALLQQRSTLNGKDYPYSVATTWTFSFEQIEQSNPAAASLLRLCAFLHPDAIPEEMIVAGAAHLDSYLQPLAADPFALDAAIRPLFSYSLIHRKAKTLTLHRLVQAVIKDGMSRETYREWVEYTIRMVNAAFPDGSFATWPDCERYLPHAQVCATLIEQENVNMPEAAHLLNRMGYYLTKRARYAEAVPLLSRALSIGEQQLGSQHLYTAEILNNLAIVYRELCKYEQAEPLYQRALAIREQQLGVRHPDTASTLNELAELYHEQKEYLAAEQFRQRALEIREQVLGSEHADTAASLDGLAETYFIQERYREAEPLWRRALAIRQQILGPQHPDTAESLNDLGLLFYAERKYEKAEPLYQQALAILTRQLGPEHRYTATTLHNLAALYKKQGRYAEAESFWQRVLTIRKQVLGPQHPDTANVLLYLAMIYNLQGRYTEAEPLLQEALAIRERHLGPEHPDIAPILFNLAILYSGQQRYKEAEHALRRTLAIRQQHLGSEHPDTLHCLHSLALLYSLQGRYDLAELLYSRA